MFRFIIIGLLFISSYAQAAQLLTISSTTAKTGIQAEGDVVGVFEDSHIFSEDEKKLFTIISVIGLTKYEVINAQPVVAVDDITKKFSRSINKLSANDILLLQNELTVKTAKEAIINKMEINHKTEIREAN